ncbi:MAG: response regulator transcription factor [Methanobacterium sp.]|nr:response regulator transcription factor [Methanobacterium sp.]
MKILVAEDNLDMQNIIRLYLTREGYQVSTASDGNEALELLYTEPFDLVVLDWMMPGTDGIAVCNTIRELHIPAKIIMLTAKGEAQNEITGLSCGADDYIKKPFKPRILLLRIQKLLQLEQVLYCGTVFLNQQTQIVKQNDRELNLSKKEYELLHFFLLNQNQILSREQLLNQIWGMDYEGDERTVDTHIRRVRSKIGDTYIKTHIGLGYSMEAPHE